MAMQIFDLYKANLDGTKLIEASAGTGKTFTLSGLYIRYIVEKKLLPEQILVLTFTTATTSELKMRLRKQLIACKNHLLGIKLVKSDDKQLFKLYEGYKADEFALKYIELALICFDQAAIHTINGFCQKVIDDYNSDCGSPVFHELIVQRDYVKKFVYEFWRKQQKDTPTEILATIPPIDKVINKLNSLLNKSHYQQVKPLIDWYATQVIYQQYKVLAAQWQQQEEVLLDYILSGDFHGSTYKVTNRVVYQQDMDKFFNCFDGNVLKFRASHIESKLGKKNTLKPMPKFFMDFEELFEQVLYIYKVGQTGNNLTISYMYECYNYVQQKLIELRVEQGKFDYSDQIKVVHTGIQDSPKLVDKIASQWQCVMVDEFQDTDSMQLQIFDKCFNDGKHDLIYVGDPKQAIYDFRGADVFVYNQAKGQVQEQFNLVTNYRSSDKMLAASNAMFDFYNSFRFVWLQFTASRPKPEQDQQLQDIYPPVAIIDCPQADRKSILVNEIKRFLSHAKINQDQLKPEQCAILLNRNKDAIDLYEFLLAQNISVSLWSESGVFATEIAKQLYYLIRAINYPSKSNIFTSLHGLFFDVSLNQLQQLDMEETLAEFVNYRANLSKQDIVQVIKDISKNKQINQRLLQLIDGERHFTDLQHMLELLQKQLDAGSNHNQLEQWLATQIQQAQVMEHEEQRKRRIESDTKKIAIMTIHKSKGLEFDHVFIPYADKITDKKSNEAINLRACLATHDDNNQDKIYWQHCKTAQDSYNQEKQAENIRNLYVAITRAKYRVYIGVDLESSGYNNLPIAKLINNIKNNTKLCATIIPQQSAYKAVEENVVKLAKPRKFKRNIQKPQAIYSFSALSKKQIISYEANEQISNEIDYNNYFQFPKGAKSGTMQHAILENLAFDAELNTIEMEVTKQLKRNDYDNKWQACLSLQIQQILNTKLWKNGAKLATINNHVDEMEFMLPIAAIEPSQISQWLTQHRNTQTKFNQDNLGGFLTGFIDLTFEFNNKFYVVDYKSNYLGKNFDDYTDDKLKQAIEHHYYDLQYLLYSVALVKYLTNKIDNFDYQNHFGGIAYIFTRGVNGKTGQGVYCNKPAAKLIKHMLEEFNVS